MSFFGSPPSNAFNNHEYDFDEERAEEDDDKEQDKGQFEGSDEDTEDASETDTGPQEEQLEIKEQMYQDKLASLKKKLSQLKDGTHPEYNKKVRKLEFQYAERLKINEIYREYMIEYIKRDYAQEIKAAAKDFEEKKIDLRETLISDLDDKKKTIESERLTMELTGDSMEVKPAMTRKLRRRPNEPIPMPEKRRKVPITQITYLLDEKDIEHDLRLIKEKVAMPVRKLSESSSSMSSPSHNFNTIGGLQSVSEQQNLIETRIEDGKLLYEKRWFHRGQSIFVEGKDQPKTAGTISAVGNDFIVVKKQSGEKLRFFVSSLARGKISIKRRAA
ncbi:sin3 histone deacetylase corepressor complex component SDS3 [Anthonomus grandis grandis]|uniref:sin3 histone deacetylase corepressor complex component SDS3 n=1 Tax=Anthonomus grandis grandis TaxID=2921223 RepID=UPI002165D038|nr:sin3 histone deacetylase corepressor complex component SDS3 [Anthonomus grandis grandis]